LLDTLVGLPIGVRVSGAGRLQECVGLQESKDRVARVLDPGEETCEPLKALLDRMLDESALKRTWEEAAVRYVGRKIGKGQVLIFPEVFHLPTVPKLDLPYFSAQTVLGTTDVKGRPGMALSVQYFSASTAVASANSTLPTTLAMRFAAWVPRAKPALSVPGLHVEGGGLVVVAMSGVGILEESISLNVTLRGGVAALAGRPGGPRIRRMVIRNLREKEIVGPERSSPRGGLDPSTDHRLRSRH